MCRTGRTVGTINKESEDDIFLGTVNACAGTVSSTGSTWVVDLTLNRHPVQFKIGTGADVTVIGETNYNEARDGPLQSSKTTLNGPSQTPLEVLGKFQANLRHNDRETQDDVFVIKGLRQPLVGRPAITSLNLLLRVEPVSKNSGLNKETVIKQFPKLFRELGTLKGAYQIKLIPNAVPFVLTTPCRVPIPLLPKFKAELKTNGTTWSHLQDRGTNVLVCWDGGGTKRGRECKDMRQPYKIKQRCV